MASRASAAAAAAPKSSKSRRKNPRLLSHLLYDRVTDLPTLPLFLGRIRRELKRRSGFGLITLNVIQNQRIEQILGWEAFDALIRDLAQFLRQMKPVALRDEDVVSELMISGNAFVILLAPPRNQESISYEDMEKVRRRLEKHLKPFLSHRLAELGTLRLELSIGCAILQGGGESRRIERMVYQALDAAFLDAMHRQRRGARRETRQLRELLRLGKIRTVFQPVVDLEGRVILGYEALSRPIQSEFQNPEHLFRVAYACEEVWALERLCRRKALENLAGLAQGQLLFLNIEPESVYDPELRVQMGGDFLTEAGVKPDRIVLEITEHAAVKDFPLFRQALRHFQNQGFRLAMDDVGSAYSGLKTIAEIRPDFIKIDMSLTRDVHANDIKRELLSTICKFSRTAGITVIAEGIEHAEDLRTLREIGVRFAQGFLLARPDQPFPPVDFVRIPE